MIKIKRLKNLSLLKNKFLNVQRNEIASLSKELEKCNKIKKKLREILSNTKNKNNTKAVTLRENNKFILRILEQISITENRIRFLEIELTRAKNNLVKIIKQKEKVEITIKHLTKNKLELKEKRYLDTMPPQRNL